MCDGLIIILLIVTTWHIICYWGARRVINDHCWYADMWSGAAPGSQQAQADIITQVNNSICSHASRKPGLIIVKIKSMNVSNIEENHRNSIRWWWENSRHLADCRPGWNAWTHPLTAWDQGQLGGVTSQATVRLMLHASSLWMPYKKMSGWHHQWIWAPWQSLIMGRYVLTFG